MDIKVRLQPRSSGRALDPQTPPPTPPGRPGRSGPDPRPGAAAPSSLTSTISRPGRCAGSSRPRRSQAADVWSPRLVSASETTSTRWPRSRPGVAVRHRGDGGGHGQRSAEGLDRRPAGLGEQADDRGPARAGCGSSVSRPPCSPTRSATPVPVCLRARTRAVPGRGKVTSRCCAPSCRSRPAGAARRSALDDPCPGRRTCSSRPRPRPANGRAPGPCSPPPPSADQLRLERQAVVEDRTSSPAGLAPRPAGTGRHVDGPAAVSGSRTVRSRNAGCSVESPAPGPGPPGAGGSSGPGPRSRYRARAAAVKGSYAAHHDQTGRPALPAGRARS